MAPAPTRVTGRPGGGGRRTAVVVAHRNRAGHACRTSVIYGRKGVCNGEVCIGGSRTADHGDDHGRPGP